MNLLITRHDKIGDFLVTLPLCKAIKTQFPATKISVLVSKINYDFARKLPFIDDVILYQKDDFFGMVKLVRAKRFDASISAFIDTRLGWLLYLSGIKKRIAPATKIAQIFFNHKVTQRRSQVAKTEWEYNLDLSKELFGDIKLEFMRPLIDVNVPKENRVIFHMGFGGSSDGNLTPHDYMRLAKLASNTSEVVFSFGPDDGVSKEFVKQHLDFVAIIRDDFASLWDFMCYIATAKLFVSTSTGPMHLAGATNTPTLSFFGKSLFASSRRWATISEPNLQANFMIAKDYNEEEFERIQNQIINILTI